MEKFKSTKWVECIADTATHTIGWKYEITHQDSNFYYTVNDKGDVCKEWKFRFKDVEELTKEMRESIRLRAVIKWVECIATADNVTIGKKYKVFPNIIDELYYLIENDIGGCNFYSETWFKDIEKPKMFYIRVNEDECRELPERIAMRATIIDDDYQSYKDNPLFIALYKANRKTKKALEDFKFDMRHSNTKN